jgi:hypothetical protein
MTVIKKTLSLCVFCVSAYLYFFPVGIFNMVDMLFGIPQGVIFVKGGM